jgi:hypothetical protein
MRAEAALRWWDHGMTESIQPWIGGAQAPVPRPEDADPFRYGWRYTRHSDGVLGEPLIPLSITAHRRGSRGYVGQPLDADGRFRMEAADLWIGTRPGPHGSRAGSVALWLQDADEPLPGYSGLADENRRVQARAADAERAKADAEGERDDAIRRLREMEAELKRLRGEV